MSVGASMEKVSIHQVHREVFPMVESPSFVARYPHVVNDGLIPQSTRDAMRTGWLTGDFQPHPVHIVRLYDVYVTGEGLIFDKHKSLITESITQHTSAECEQAFERVRSAVNVPVEWLASVLLRKRGDGNYGHWMIEALPKLWISEGAAKVEACVVPKTIGPMREVMRTAVDRSASSYPFIETDNDQVLFFKQLLFVDGLTHHGVYMSPLALSRVDRIAGCAHNTGRKIYVSRHGAARNIANEHGVETALKCRGFEIINPGSMALQEQIDTFASSDVVVGVMGAGMTNTMFCRPGTKVINLSPATMPDTFFYFISVHRGLAYTEIRGQNMDGGDGWDQPFIAPLPELINAI